MINLAFWWKFYWAVWCLQPNATYNVAPREGLDLSQYFVLSIAVTVTLFVATGLAARLLVWFTHRRIRDHADMQDLRNGEGVDCSHGVRKWKRCSKCAAEAFPEPKQLLVPDGTARPSKIDCYFPVEKKVRFDPWIYEDPPGDVIGKQQWPAADNRYTFDPAVWKDREIYIGTREPFKNWVRLKSTGMLFKVERVEAHGNLRLYTVSRDYTALGKQEYQFLTEYLEQAAPRDGEPWQVKRCHKHYIVPTDDRRIVWSSEMDCYRDMVRCGCLVSVL